MCVARHDFANGSDCPVLASYQMWFAKFYSKFLKNAKINRYKLKIW